ncbi:contact-dependent growth inhibition system immunity protein [Caballeronia udeis]|nr:contact-dependent growth inhibition system immunity protein [Caballeronia udeis]
MLDVSTTIFDNRRSAGANTGSMQRLANISVNMLSEPNWKSRLTAKMTEEFLCIVPQSGYRLAMAEPMATERLLTRDASAVEIGNAIQGALAESRFLSLKEASALSLTAESRYSEWVQSLMDRFAYKTRRALFKNMKSCSVARSAERLVFVPSHHDKLDSWSRSVGDGIEDVIIPGTSSPSEIGAALIVAFGRCT